MQQVLCVGGVNADHVLELDDLPTGEGKHIARGYRWSGGGVAATAAVAIARLGGRVAWCGLVGDDNTGSLLIEQLTAFGVVLADKCVVPGAQSPVSSVLVDNQGRRWLGWHPGSGLDPVASPPQVPELDDTAVVLGDLWSVELTKEVFSRAAERGLPRVLDMETPNRPGSRELIDLADNVIFSAEGLVEFAETANTDEALTMAGQQITHATVAVTLGPMGSAWWADGEVHYVAAPTVDAKDTTGCGDVFHGAYALGLAEGRTSKEAAVLATAAAALKAERGNGWNGMPDRADTEALLQKGWT